MVSVRSTKILIVWREGEEGSASELKANTCLHVASTLELVLKRNTKCIPLLATSSKNETTSGPSCLTIVLPC